MTIEKAKEKLAAYRNKQRELRKKIGFLQDWLRKKGVAAAPATDLTGRNNSIYSRHLDGLSWAEIAQEFKLSKERVKQICNRIGYLNEKRAKRASGQ